MIKIEPTFTARVHIAGDIEQAKQWLRKHCYSDGLCVTVEPTTFVYTGGEESGMVIGLINYPRFPSTPGDITKRAVIIAESLIRELNQKSACVVTTTDSHWISIDPPGARS